MSCNKVSYSSMKEAKDSIRDMKNSHQFNKRNNNSGEKSRPYKCDICESYHLTTMSTAEYKRQNKKIKEKNRRLGIMEQIQKNGNIAKVFELQEYWMTLISKKNGWTLECEVLGRFYYINHLEATNKVRIIL